MVFVIRHDSLLAFFTLALIYLIFQFTHLQHAPFEYQINVTNETMTMKQGTCRIFLIPKYDERGQQIRFRDQRSFAIEMDKFLVNCKYIITIEYHYIKR